MSESALILVTSQPYIRAVSSQTASYNASQSNPAIVSVLRAAAALTAADYDLETVSQRNEYAAEVKIEKKWERLLRHQSSLFTFN